MQKNYKEIEFSCGSNIESSINQLNHYKQKNELVFGVFNGYKLYSDVDDLDSAYKKITGKTKAEFDKRQKEISDEYEESERKHKDSIPSLTIEWIDKGKSILDEKYHEIWIKCVPIRLGDLYKGMELKACLDIVKELNNGCSLDEAKKIIDNQGHSGMSFGLVCSMVNSFCDRGEEFKLYVK
jgi:hypothetical protein